MAILSYIEHNEGTFKKSAFETMTFAKDLADSIGQKVVTVTIGEVAEDELKKLGQYGADRILHINQEGLKRFYNVSYTNILSQVVEKEDISTIVLSSSFAGKELAPRLAGKLKAAYINGALDTPINEGGNLQVKKSVFSNKAFANELLTSEKRVITVNPNTYAVKESQGTSEVEAYQLESASNAAEVIFGEIAASSDKISLPEAEIVVSGGRGMKGPENWGLIEELAEALGAATACSKPVSDAGWRPHSEHVGQTGIAISPKLYVAVGISGAIQHLAGVSSSKVIVVINKDPEAPFFKVADYGIVGDAFEVLPKLTEAIKAYKNS
ncbi:MAG TPA: electron transfer flavoprotein subunit alpha/FixB family protein [Candidatus Sphingobacterium stercoripullorum]|uniref:Electron transfer flavoprotein subunit alpha/FixB family protein n=1 Tax=Candidatus Sphingobacterium stercoripullorum TaxID=2838759 RepID=A0A9D2AYV2_9SPHI|nr:electron transfer flavoprotein subunit alpha/FixB family protein [Candidatus Sphingobacterium stercoripullorum]